MGRKIWYVFVLNLFSLFFDQCGKDDGSVNLDINKKAFDKLSQYHFFKGKISDLLPNEGVLPYDLITPLFTDYAHKSRFVWMPQGKTAKYSKDEVLDFPIGTVIIKNFYYPKDFNAPNGPRSIMETRLLVRRADKWDALSYVWNKEQTEADLNIVGDNIKVDWKNLQGEMMHTEYAVPNKNQCKNCHSFNAELVPIGPKIRNLNHDFAYSEGKKNQLDKWTESGYLSGYIAADNQQNKLTDWENKGAKLDDRAKSYLEVNCAHCHRREGSANTSGLYLLVSDKNPESWGIMKSPVAAGRASGDFLYDILPGHPEQSIMPYRMNSTDPEIMMPELGRRLIHKEAVELINAWIKEMK